MRMSTSPGRALSESAFEGGPDLALGVHRIVDDRDHAEKAVDHPGIFSVLDRHACTAQRLCIAFAIVVQYVAFCGDDDCRGDAGSRRRRGMRRPA